MNRSTTIILCLGAALLMLSPFFAIKLGRKLASHERMSFAQQDEEDNSPEAIKARLAQETRSQAEHERAVQENDRKQMQAAAAARR